MIIGFLATTDSMICQRWPRLARWQVVQVGARSGIRLTLEEMRFRYRWTAKDGARWATQRLDPQYRQYFTYEPQRIERP